MISATDAKKMYDCFINNRVRKILEEIEADIINRARTGQSKVVIDLDVCKWEVEAREVGDVLGDDYGYQVTYREDPWSMEIKWGTP